MNRDEIIRMAQSICDEDKVDAWHNGFWTLTQEELERFAALVAASSEEKWKQAVIDELVCCHIYGASHENDPRKALHDAISWNVQVALDPQVSSDAQNLIDRGAAAERERIKQEQQRCYVARGQEWGNEERNELLALQAFWEYVTDEQI